MPKGSLDKLTDELFDSVWARPNSDFPETVYHYTTAAGLVGMLVSRRVWATDCRCLNDESESELGIRRARELIRGRSLTAKEPRLKAFYRALRAYLGLPNPDRNFVFSLSSRADDLSQWRAYANEGRGFTVGFNTRSLFKHGNAPANHFGFSKVSYNATRQEKQIRDIIAKFENEVVQSTLAGEELDAFADEAAASADWIISAASVLHKHRRFLRNANGASTHMPVTTTTWGSERPVTALFPTLNLLCARKKKIACR